MIKNIIKPEKVDHICDRCGYERTIEIERRQLRWLEEFSQWENYPLPPCENCGTIEVLNMNLPDDEADIADTIPDDEWRQRHWIKNIKRFVMGETEEISEDIPERVTDDDDER